MKKGQIRIRNANFSLASDPSTKCGRDVVDPNNCFRGWRVRAEREGLNI